MKKLVKESLNEKLGFQEESDPIRSMGIGICSEIEKYCEQVIKTCKGVNNEYESIYGDDLEDADIEEFYSYSNNEGRIEVCQKILDMIKKL